MAEKKTEVVENAYWKKTAVAVNMNDAVKTASIIKKISTMNVVGKIKELVLEHGIPKDCEIPVMRVVGSVVNIRTGQTQHGEFVALKGEFIAINLQNGDAYRAGQAFLPESTCESGVVLQLATEGVKKVDFAFDFFIHYSANSATGYEYSAKSLLPPSQSDPLAALCGMTQNLLIEG